MKVVTIIMQLGMAIDAAEIKLNYSIESKGLHCLTECASLEDSYRTETGLKSYGLQVLYTDEPMKQETDCDYLKARENLYCSKY